MEKINKPTYLISLTLAFLVIANYMIMEAQGYVHKPFKKINHNKSPHPKDKYSNHGNVQGGCTPGSTHTKCSPPVTSHTEATLTQNSFQKGGSGGGPSECDGQYHNDNTLIVALSTGWYNNGKRCYRFVKINGNGRSVKAMVVDECDALRGCKNNIVDASDAVWNALGVKSSDPRWGLMGVTWCDA